MRNDLLDRIPDDLLLIIFRHIRPSVKYKLTKTYFIKFYFIRLGYINNKILLHNVKRIVKYECYIIKNYNYIKYLIRNDLLFVIKNVIDYKLSNDKSKYILKKPMIFENIKFINVDLVSGKPSTNDFITEAFKNNFDFDFDQKNDNKNNNFDLRGFY